MNPSLRVCKKKAKKTAKKSYYSPCNQMEIFSKFDQRQSKKGDNTRITFLYEETNYEEVTNTRSFDFASFVSGVGGFIGIFLGYSLLQIPDLIELVPSFMSSLGQNIIEGYCCKQIRSFRCIQHFWDTAKVDSLASNCDPDGMKQPTETESNQGTKGELV